MFGMVFAYCKLGFERMVTDKMHIATHTCSLCKLNSNECMLHPNLYKFNGILNKTDGVINEQIVEQFWIVDQRQSNPQVQDDIY